MTSFSRVKCCHAPGQILLYGRESTTVCPEICIKRTKLHACPLLGLLLAACASVYVQAGQCHARSHVNRWADLELLPI